MWAELSHLCHHHLLSEIHQREVQLWGIDRKTDVINRCTQLANELGLAGLTFSAGEIPLQPLSTADAASLVVDSKAHACDLPLIPEETGGLPERLPKVHLALSLHACNTATDAALEYAVRAQAEVILAVPCCQHEAAPQLQHADFEPVLRHGILRERLGALATDALRAAALEACGYRTQIIEFIDLEHTPKNLLIRAVRRYVGESATAGIERYERLKSMLGVQQLATDRLLAFATPLAE